MNESEYYKRINTLSCVYGPRVWDIRHELYFILKKKNPFLRGLASLIRDSLRLYFVRKQSIASNAIFFAISLPGRSGWLSVGKAYAKIQEEGSCSAYVISARNNINRLEGCSVTRLNPISLLQFIRAYIKANSLINKSRNLNRYIVVLLYWRHLLWCDAWCNTIKGKNNVLITHNDFDMASFAGIKVFRSRGISINIQHGIPTDEFFPPNADYQAVWGQKSKSIYSSYGVNRTRQLYWNPEHLKAKKGISSGDCPTCISFISQTHTEIYGQNMFRISKIFVERMHEICISNDIEFKILLHPSECEYNSIPYQGNYQVSRPPHQIFSEHGAPTLLVGFSSTAFIDGHLSGHYILGLSFSPLQSKFAHELISPIHIANSSKEVLSVFKGLQNSKSKRKSFLEAQNLWYRSIVDGRSEVVEFAAEYLDHEK
jgi:hypothetical protein